MKASETASFTPYVVPTPEQLEGRVAKCAYCKAERPSSNEMAFFEYRGPGSRDAAMCCGVSVTERHGRPCGPERCGAWEVAHLDPPHPPGPYHDFVAHGPFEFDRYYCGCRGWD